MDDLAFWIKSLTTAVSENNHINVSTKTIKLFFKVHFMNKVHKHGDYKNSLDGLYVFKVTWQLLYLRQQLISLTKVKRSEP